MILKLNLFFFSFCRNKPYDSFSMPIPTATATAEHGEELWGKPKIEAKVTILWSSVDRK